MRVVLDTNIVISGVFWDSGPPHKIIQSWLAEKITVIVSSEILEEYRRLVKRLSEKKGIDVSKLIERLLMLSELVFPINLVAGICTDPDDDNRRTSRRNAH